MITREIAEMLVKETSKVLNLNINIMNEEGVIIATGDPSRLNSIHEGALEVVKTGQLLEITSENQGQLRGTQQGINLPIHFHDGVVGVIGITGEPRMIGDRGGLVKMMAELLIKQAYMASQTEWRQRTKERIIEELLKEEPNTSNIERWLSLLQMKLKGPFVISLIEIVDYSFSSHSLIKNTEEVIGKGKVLAGFVHVNKLLLILSEVSHEEAKRKLKNLHKEFERMKVYARLAYSSHIDHLRIINQGYCECEIALAISKSEHKVISYLDIEPEALVHQINPKLAEPFCKRILQGEGDLNNHLDTLQAFFDSNFNIKEAAKKLYIHRNTLIYRLNKIKTESGYDPQNFKDAFALQMAIWLNKRASSPPN
ncbi:sugar diacid recognition domain-containing protein [Fredinandcohnia sp. QZ13]|uniref:CdaR family transcriptional regulator n=1 Tax=Fredinandcohnia sp. QZ13 TaxID=3073144 RepID=UPI0028532894|nr:sugar diacid recognition domain-containing protein [Fredinandcohnia sp. QZ13]MDR4890429.1 sugar diacid recognition domain-containing protein [Fredinandcohnia sp. QZ13]